MTNPTPAANTHAAAPVVRFPDERLARLFNLHRVVVPVDMGDWLRHRATHERSRNLRSVSVLRMSVAIAATVALVYALLLGAMLVTP